VLVLKEQISMVSMVGAVVSIAGVFMMVKG
jgi:hypothetical protein